MKPRSRRRRALLLLALALASGGLAASQVQSSVRAVEAQVGAPVPVVVAATDVRDGTRIATGNVGRLLAVREVPASFVAPGSLSQPEEALGLRLDVPVAAGGYLTVGHFAGPDEAATAGPPLGPGERVVEIAVAGGAAAAGPGALVDVLVTSGDDPGAGRTYVALQSIELVDVQAAAVRGEAPATAPTVASLRVTLEQAVLLTAAQNFAREVRLLVRSPEDRRRVGPTSVEASEL